MDGTITAFYLSVNTRAVFTRAKLPIVAFAKQLPDNLLFQLFIDPAAELSVHSCINRQNKNQYLIVKCFKRRNKDTERLCVNYLRI